MMYSILQPQPTSASIRAEVVVRGGCAGASSDQAAAPLLLDHNKQVAAAVDSATAAVASATAGIDGVVTVFSSS
jgi:hypothetical protein